MRAHTYKDMCVCVHVFLFVGVYVYVELYIFPTCANTSFDFSCGASRCTLPSPQPDAPRTGWLLESAAAASNISSTDTAVRPTGYSRRKTCPHQHHSRRLPSMAQLSWRVVPAISLTRSLTRQQPGTVLLTSRARPSPCRFSLSLIFVSFDICREMRELTIARTQPRQTQVHRKSSLLKTPFAI